jgi:hypothetical protein
MGTKMDYFAGSGGENAGFLLIHRDIGEDITSALFSPKIQVLKFRINGTGLSSTMRASSSESTFSLFLAITISCTKNIAGSKFPQIAPTIFKCTPPFELPAKPTGECGDISRVTGDYDGDLSGYNY